MTARIGRHCPLIDAARRGHRRRESFSFGVSRVLLKGPVKGNSNPVCFLVTAVF